MDKSVYYNCQLENKKIVMDLPICIKQIVSQIVNFNFVQAQPTLFQFLLTASSLVSASLQTLLGL